MTIDPDYVAVSTAAEMLGISRLTMRRRVRADAVPTFADPRDQRYVLIKVADVEQLRVPRPLTAPREAVAAVG